MATTTFWQKVEQFFTSLRSAIEAHFGALIAQFETGIGPTVLADAETLVADMADTALGTMTGAQLVDQAVALIKGLATKGITVAEPLAITAIQAAVANKLAAAQTREPVTQTADGTNG
jgi:hypothetical protein